MLNRRRGRGPAGATDLAPPVEVAGGWVAAEGRWSWSVRCGDSGVRSGEGTVLCLDSHDAPGGDAGLAGGRFAAAVCR